VLTPEQKAVADRMIALNRRTTPLVEIQTLGDSQTTRINQYKSWGDSLLLPERTYIKQGNNHTELRIEFLSYDEYGNPTSIIKDNAEKVTYLWAYSGQHPIAEIAGTTYAEVMTNSSVASQYSHIKGQLSPNAEEIWTLGSTLRQNFPHAFVTTYTYEPLVGMTSQTDPVGITSYYEYDCFGRLLEIYQLKNRKKEILQKYDYRYANQTFECPEEVPCQNNFGSGLLNVYSNAHEHEPQVKIGEEFYICNPVSVKLKLRVDDKHNNLCRYYVRIINMSTGSTIERMSHNFGQAIISEIDFEKADLLTPGSYRIELERAADPPYIMDPNNPPYLGYNIYVHYSFD
jgi:6-pyruvoyl-tetrahydropterin synthase